MAEVGWYRPQDIFQLRAEFGWFGGFIWRRVVVTVEPDRLLIEGTDTNIRLERPQIETVTEHRALLSHRFSWIDHNGPTDRCLHVSRPGGFRSALELAGWPVEARPWRVR